MPLDSSERIGSRSSTNSPNAKREPSNHESKTKGNDSKAKRVVTIVATGRENGGDAASKVTISSRSTRTGVQFSRRHVRPMCPRRLHDQWQPVQKWPRRKSDEQRWTMANRRFVFASSSENHLIDHRMSHATYSRRRKIRANHQRNCNRCAHKSRRITIKRVWQ